MATYTTRIAAHSTRTGVQRDPARIRLLVIHTSEGGEGDVSAENLAAFIATPRSATNLASYHYIVDTDGVIPIVPDDWVAYAAAGANNDGLHACYPGKAGQSVEQWADPVSARQHEQAAQWLADKSKQYDIPLRKLTAAQVRDGERGVCGHAEVSLAFKRSTHTDPGKAFPWDALIARAVEIATPPPPAPNPPITGDDDDMVMCVNRNGAYWLTNQVRRTALVYPGNDLALIALMWEYEDQGVKFASPRGTQGDPNRIVPVPFTVSPVQAPTFDATPVG